MSKRKAEEIEELGEDEMGKILQKYLQRKARVLELEAELSNELRKIKAQETSVPELKHLGGLVKSLRRTKFLRNGKDGDQVFKPHRPPKKKQASADLK